LLLLLLMRLLLVSISDGQESPRHLLSRLLLI
jgi:hypothetical protein